MISRLNPVKAIIISLLLAIGTTGCEKYTGSKTPLYKGDTIMPTDSCRKVLVAYFSISGNTEKVAQAIADNTGGTLFRIERQKPYPEEFRKYADEAKTELDDSIYPALKTKVDSIGKYDVIFVGCPVWWHTTPRVINTFLEKEGYNFSNKVVVPFCTYANMFPHETLLEIVNKTPDAIHPDGFISEDGDTTGVYQWLKTINLNKKQ